MRRYEEEGIPLTLAKFLLLTNGVHTSDKWLIKCPHETRYSFRYVFCFFFEREISRELTGSLYIPKRGGTEMFLKLRREILDASTSNHLSLISIPTLNPCPLISYVSEIFID